MSRLKVSGVRNGTSKGEVFMAINQTSKIASKAAVLALLGLVAAVSGATDISTVPLSTYSATSSTDIKPNVLFILDDSGSMDWDYMPDQTNSAIQYRFRNSSYNGMAYNPAIVYKPPINVNSSGVTDTTTYKNMTGVDTSTGGNSSATSTTPNWSQVKNDAYGIQSTANDNLTPSATAAPYYYTTIPGEYCKTASLRDCQVATAPTTTYPYPAMLRWCSSSALTTCQAAYDATNFSFPRMPSPRTATISITSASSGVISGITVDSKQIMSASTAASSTASTVAQAIVDQINACTYIIQGNCQIVGYTASRNNAVVTISAPGVTSSAPVVTVGSGTAASTIVAFAQGAVPGENLRTTITPTVDSYAYPGTSAKAAARTDCVGTTCTYKEAMANYANWHTYYRTRMQMMKTASSNALAAVDSAADIAAGKSRFRLGFMTINNNNTTDFVNLGEFTGAQKYAWYQKLIKAQPNNSTPLREALANAGRLYGGKLNGSTFHGVTVVDPLQYSCQQNFTILSTDGFWNGNAGYKLDGSTAVGNQDAGLSPPYGDGGTSQAQSRTSTLQTAPVAPRFNKQTNSLQSRTVTSQTAPSIQTRTSTDKGVTWTAWSNVSSCTVSKPNKSNNWTDCQFPKSTSSDSGTTWTNWTYATSCTTVSSGTSRTACSGTVTSTSSWANVSSCTVTGGVQCQYPGWSAATTVSSCTDIAPSATSPYTVGTAVQCTATTGSTGTWTNATGTCVQTSTNSCQYTTWTSWSNVTSCTAVAQDAGPTFTVLTARECRSTATGGTFDTLADVAAYYYSTDLRSPTATGTDATGTCTGPIISPNTTPNDLCANNVATTLADPATTQHMTTFTLGLGAQGKMIYAPADGINYWNDTSGDFYDVKKTSTASPSTGICTWQSSGGCYWPTPAANSNANIDDLWHAAVNGHGTYFSARDPSSLASSLTSLLAKISNIPRPGTAAAAASSNPNVSTSDNYVFSSSYRSVDWYGELVRQQITTGGTLTAQNWSAMRLLDCATTPWSAVTSYRTGNVYRQGSDCHLVLGDYTSGASFDGSITGVDGQSTRILKVDEASSTSSSVVAKTSRTIYTNSSSALVSFDWTSLVTAGLDGNFTQTYLTGRLSQFCASGVDCLSSANQASASGSALVEYLRGDRTNEKTYYRERAHVLGDIVASEARYVKAPLFNYVDAGYSDFKALMKTRSGAVYVGANDGMLHAFDAVNGQELWAYIPRSVLPTVHALADRKYADNHQFFVDNTPEVGEISVPCTPVFPATTCNPWKTILVGGLNRGGSSYYALDITDPANPKFLWEFTHSTMGYSYGNPRITKLKDGTWVVMLTSGYNNADDKGYLYVVNAQTGALIRSFIADPGTGKKGDLARISAHAKTADTNNTVTAVYGGDILGNLWRFDVNGDMGASGYDTQLLVSFQDASGNPQPITAKPTVATVDGQTVVYVGTGKYLGVTDISDSQFQSFYAVVDSGGSTTLTTPRTTGSGFVKQVLTNGTCPTGAPASVCTQGQTVRTSTSNPVNWASNKGWYMDFLGAGERASTDPSLGLGTLLFTTNLPSLTSGSVCGDPSTSGAKSFLYALDYKTGGAVSNAYGVAGVSLGDGAVTRPVMILMADGTVRALTRVSNGVASGDGSTDQGQTVITTPPISKGAGSGLRRVSWRELTMQ